MANKAGAKKYYKTFEVKFNMLHKVKINQALDIIIMHWSQKLGVNEKLKICIIIFLNILHI